MKVIARFWAVSWNDNGAISYYNIGKTEEQQVGRAGVGLEGARE